MNTHELASYYGYDCTCPRCAAAELAEAEREFDALDADALDAAAEYAFRNALYFRAREFQPPVWDDVPF